MPKVVDPVERRQQVAEAVWRVISRDGLGRASMRQVAAEAGLSLGSLRHYFATHTELLTFSMRLVMDRGAARLRALEKLRPADGVYRTEPVYVVEMVVSSILPLDAERQLESEVWLAFVGATVSDPQLRAISDEIYDSLLDMERGMLDQLVRSGAASGLDIDLEAMRLHSLLDGLTVGAVTRPQRVTVERIRAIVRRHLLSLCASPL
jgi:AcrR family transcriptional regulator